MERGVLFLGHSSDSQEKIIIGIRGTADHVAMISPDEALRFAYHVIETVERMEGDKHPEDPDDEEE
jgi:hypothetical protein